MRPINATVDAMKKSFPSESLAFKVRDCGGAFLWLPGGQPEEDESLSGSTVSRMWMRASGDPFKKRGGGRKTLSLHR